VTIQRTFTFECDSCSQEFMIDESMEMPPYWFGAQVVIADSEGYVPDQDELSLLHFCSQKCLYEYAKGSDLKERAHMIDKVSKDETNNRDDNDENV